MDAKRTGWARAHTELCRTLEAERQGRPHWRGRLATSALATAVAVSALSVAVGHDRGGRGVEEDDRPRDGDPNRASSATATAAARRAARDRGVAWLLAHPNADGGWGDTVVSASNGATTLLALSALALAGVGADHPVRAAGRAWLDAHGGAPAVAAAYGRDRTFAVPILTNAVLAGLAEWSAVPHLPFEISVLPRPLFTLMRMPVVSYAMPALIAMGLVRHRLAPSRNPAARLLRTLAAGPALRRLTRLIPASGGFLEATPLTGFVAMSLVAAGAGAHPAVGRGLAFLLAGQRADGGWPIDSDLAVWNTSLAVQALGGGEAATAAWLLARQERGRHPFTGARPGGWGWTDLPGRVPDADDTAGAVLALARLPRSAATVPAVRRGLAWLRGLQNADGGIPTFCRGWNGLPFDRSSPDITAHFLRAVYRWRPELPAGDRRRLERAAARALDYLGRHQRPDGSWHPLWFGNEAAPDKANPVFGTGRVLTALGEITRPGPASPPPAPSSKEGDPRPDLPLGPEVLARGRGYLLAAQNPDGSWGGAPGVPGTLEETGVALEGLLALAGDRPDEPALARGLDWIADRIEAGAWERPAPIGLYFASLWYHERLYPLTLAGAALRRALDRLECGKEAAPGP